MLSVDVLEHMKNEAVVQVGVESTGDILRHRAQYCLLRRHGSKFYSLVQERNKLSEVIFHPFLDYVVHAGSTSLAAISCAACLGLRKIARDARVLLRLLSEFLERVEITQDGPIVLHIVITTDSAVCNHVFHLHLAQASKDVLQVRATLTKVESQYILPLR